MSGVKVEIKGTSALNKKLLQLSKEYSREVKQAIQLGTLAVHEEAVKSINAHMSKGEKYGNHVASKEGYPPNTDTGRLASSIKFEFEANGLTGIVGTNLDYGKMLEFGTSKVGERPWLSRAYNLKEKEVLNMLKKAIEDVK